MDTLKLNPKNLKEINKKVSDFIKEGKIIIYPTDTVYGLICDAKNKKAVQKVFKIKKRDPKKPLPLFVRDLKMAKKFARIDKKQEKFFKNFWPGKTTMVLERKGKEEIYGVDKKTIAIRIPKYKPLNCLLKDISRPVAQTSANISGGANPDSIKEVLKQFREKPHTKFGGGHPDLIIDGGTLSKKSSTVIDLTKPKPEILRE